MEHELKLHPKYFERVSRGEKTFEVRKNDRDYQVGDTVIMREFDPEKGWPDHGSYESIVARITYLTTFEQKDGFCVFAFEVMPIDVEATRD